MKEKSDFKEGTVVVSKIDDEYERMFQKDCLPSEIRPKKNMKFVMKFENGDEHKGKVIEVNKPNSKHKFKCLIKLKEGKIIEVDFENEIKNWKYLLDKEEKEAEEERETRKNMELDNIRTYRMKISNDECLVEEMSKYLVEVPRSRHHEPEVLKAKEKELQNF